MDGLVNQWPHPLSLAHAILAFCSGMQIFCGVKYLWMGQIHEKLYPTKLSSKKVGLWFVKFIVKRMRCTAHIIILMLTLVVFHASLSGPTCDDGDVRLIDGSDYKEGRVEICLNNTWGSICEGGFNETAATVVCNQLGLGTCKILPGGRGAEKSLDWTGMFMLHACW